MAQNYINFFYSILLSGMIIGFFKSIDWLISTKYKTKDDCEACRAQIFENINKDRELLARLDGKLDLILKQTKRGKND